MMKTVQNIFSKKLYYFVFLSLALIAVIYVHWLALILFCFFLTKLISRLFNIGRITASVYSILCLVAFVGLLGFIIDIVLPYGSQFPIITYTLIISSSCFAILTSSTPDTHYSSTSVKSELLSIIISVLAVLFLIVPLFSINGGSEMVRFLSSGEDNASHFAMFQRNLLTQSTPYQDSYPTGLISSLDIYPQGVHSFAAYFYWSILGNQTFSVSALLKMYYLVTVLLSAGLTYFSTLIISSLAKGRLKNTTAILGSVTIFLGANLYLAGWGFVTQIVALIYLLSILYLLILNKAHESITNKSLIGRLILYAALCLGITFSWFLVLPVALAGLLKALYTSFKQARLLTLSITTITVILLLSPILLNVLQGKGTGALNEPGGVYEYGILAYIVFCVGILIYIFHLYNRRTDKGMLNDETLAFIGASFMLSILIGTYQLLTIGTVEYYYFKSLYLVFILSVILTIALLSNYPTRNRILKKSHKLPIVMWGIFTIGYAIINPTYPIVYLNNWFNHSLEPTSIAKAITFRDSRQTPVSDVVYLNTCNNITEYILNRWTGAIYLSENKARSDLAHKTLDNIPRESDISTYSYQKRNTLVVNQNHSCL